MKERSPTSLSSTFPSPSPNDVTIQASNVSSSTTPVVETIADADPDYWDEGRDACNLDVNAVDVCFPAFLPSADVLSDEPTLLQSNDIDELDTVHAQLDSGAFVSCTDQLHMLHDYQEFSTKNPCPIHLMPAKHGSDVLPQGVGYLHVPAPNVKGHIAVCTFYSPSLHTMVIDECDFLKSSMMKPKDFSGDQLVKYNDSGSCTFHASHRLCWSQDVIVHGVLWHGKCYMHPLILPCLPATHASATAANLIDVTIATDPDFAAACEHAAIQAIYTYQEEEYATLHDELSAMPMMYHGLPFHEYIQYFMPVNTIKANTAWLLWHQCLGHPSDYYLFHAHKHVKGVPCFAHMHAVLDKCPTCIQSKQTKEPAGPNTTHTATVPYQGLSIDFSFSGMKSKDAAHEKDYLGLNGETSWILVTDHFSQCLHGDTRISKAMPLAWL